MNIRKVCVVTGSRSEYGLFYPILKKILKSDNLKLQLITTSSHHSPEHGSTYREIENDGFRINDKIESYLSPDKKLSIVKSFSKTSSHLSESLDRLKPDLVLLLGDRYETLAAASTSLLMNIPIAHIHGGEKTEGAVDEQIRHSITKMSHLHFCSTEQYRQRVIQMGEDPAKVFNCGAPGIDNIYNLKALSKIELEKELRWKFNDLSALFTYHPETLKDIDIQSDLDSILRILADFKFNILFTYANADLGGNIINENIEKFCKKNPNKYRVIKNLGQDKYLSSMKYIDVIIGNSSSGIIEAASFMKPVINIGERQKGRLQSKNVINCNLSSLKESIKIALSEAFQNNVKNVVNIYGTGNAADIIVDKIANESISIIKNFKDYPKDL